MSTDIASLANAAEVDAAVFVDRRSKSTDTPARERRQFTNSHEELSPAGAELAHAIDGYKLQHRRRFINADELLKVIQDLGYAK